MITSTTITISFLVIILIFSFGVIFQKIIINKLKKMSDKTNTMVDDIAINIMSKIGGSFYLISGIFISLIFFLGLESQVISYIQKAFVVYLAFTLIMITFSTINEVRDILSIKLKNEKREQIIATFPALSIILKIISAFIISIFVLNNIGLDVTALIASLGVGGIAVAFASQKIIADLFSAFIIFLDKPFSVGHSINFGSVSGTIEKIGVKTTRIRAFTGEEIIIPNEKLVSENIKNMSNRERRKVDFSLPINYRNDKEKISKVEEIVEKIVLKNEAIFGYAKIGELGEHSILFDCVFYINSNDFANYIETKDRVLIDIVDTLKNENIELGHPIAFIDKLKKVSN